MSSNVIDTPVCFITFTAAGDHYSWSFVTKDNRKSRVLARIERWGIARADEVTDLKFHATAEAAREDLMSR